MKDFKYCIWFCPDMNHMWNHFTNRFPAHLSLKTNLDYSTALDLYSKIEKQEIEVEFDNLMCDEHDGFHALFYTIKIFIINHLGGQKILIFHFFINIIKRSLH